jgi:hypothetical protein
MSRRTDDPPVTVTDGDHDQLDLSLDAALELYAGPLLPVSTYDEPILRIVARARIVTAHQLIDRFATYDAKRRAHVVRVLRRLVDRDLLESAKMERERGRASRQVVVLTAAARRERGLEPVPYPLRERLAKREHLLQEEEFRLEHECRGWIPLVSVEDTWKWLRQLALDYYKRVDRSGLERRLIEVMRPAAIPFDVWHQPSTGALLFLVPSCSGTNLRQKLGKMPDLSLWPVLTFHLVGADPRRVSSDATLIRTWARRTRHRVHLEALHPFRTRPNPATREKLQVSIYAQHGVPSPRAWFAREAGSSHVRPGSCAAISDAICDSRPLVEGLNDENRP